ncbi:MAG: FapA family protein [Synergistaceae bacterium]|nr:FapA family protein [Synergistaceae bacterium]
MEEKFKLEANPLGVWIAAVSDDFTPAAVADFLRLKGVRKYDEKAVKEFARQKNRSPQKIADRDPLEEKLSTVIVHLPEDKMTASVTLEPPFFTNPWPDKADVLEALEFEKVVFGVDESVIEKLIELKLCDERVTVANGKPAVNGNNARIELLRDPDQMPAPAADCDDAEKIDHRERSPFVYVRQGDEIAVKHPAVPGENGMTVTGVEINPLASKDAAFPIKDGFNISDDGLSLTAAINGRLLRKNNKLTILPELEIRGDVDFSVGNIDFKGSVKIFGTVRDGFQVLASNDIEIKQMVEGARIESVTDIVIGGGIQSMGKGRIIAAGNVTANFANQAYIRSNGEITLKNSVLHSDISALQTVTVMGGKKPQIIGGRIQAEAGVVCYTLGSEIGTKTEVIVGVPPILNERRKELQDAVVKYTENLEALDTSLTFLKRQEMSGVLSEKQRSSMVGAIKSKYQLQASLRSCQDELEDINKRLEMTRGQAVVKVKDVCYPGVVVTIRDSKYIVREAFKNVAFVYDKDAREVKIRPFDDVD